MTGRHDIPGVAPSKRIHSASSSDSPTDSFVTVAPRRQGDLVGTRGACPVLAVTEPAVQQIRRARQRGAPSRGLVDGDPGSSFERVAVTMSSLRVQCPRGFGVARSRGGEAWPRLGQGGCTERSTAHRVERSAPPGDDGQTDSRVRATARRSAVMLGIYTFRLVVREAIDDEGANRLFDAGVDDGFPESGPEGHSIGFERESPSFADAVLSAISEVETAQFEVLRVEPDELVSGADIAERTGRSRQSVSSLVNGTRGPGGWPSPVAGNVRSPLWRWSDVAAWFESFDGSQSVDREQAALLAASNELLGARRALKPVPATTRRQLLRQLVPNR